METKFTKGEWKIGQTLSTRTTRSWTEQEISRSNEVENKMVFVNFNTLDEGRGRRLIAKCETKEDAKLIAAAPNMIEAIQAALRIKDLWLPASDNHNEESEGEYQALLKMEEMFNEAMKKATTL